jgi:hypothetical protein
MQGAVVITHYYDRYVLGLVLRAQFASWAAANQHL